MVEGKNDERDQRDLKDLREKRESCLADLMSLWSLWSLWSLGSLCSLAILPRSSSGGAMDYARENALPGDRALSRGTSGARRATKKAPVIKAEEVAPPGWEKPGKRRVRSGECGVRKVLNSAFRTPHSAFGAWPAGGQAALGSSAARRRPANA